MNRLQILQKAHLRQIQLADQLQTTNYTVTRKFTTAKNTSYGNCYNHQIVSTYYGCYIATGWNSCSTDHFSNRYNYIYINEHSLIALHLIQNYFTYNYFMKDVLLGLK